MLLCYVYCAMICARRFLHCVLRRLSGCVLRHSFRYVLRNVVCAVLHILRHVLCRVFFTLLVIVPRFCATACLYIPFLRCVSNSVLDLAFKCRPIYYQPMFPNIRSIYSSKKNQIDNNKVQLSLTCKQNRCAKMRNC